MSDDRILRMVCKWARDSANTVPRPVVVEPHDDPNRYSALDDRQIAHELHILHSRLLLRGRLQTLLVRREVGGLLVEFARRHPRDRNQFEAFARTSVDLAYDEARRHMQLWTHWERCFAVLERLDEEARKAGTRLTVPGLRKLLAMAGVIGKRPAITQRDVAEPPELADLSSSELPDDPAALKRVVAQYQRVNRELREQVVILRNDVQVANETITNLHRRIGQMPNRNSDR